MPFPTLPSPPIAFPAYLTNSLKFRRKSSTDSNTSTSSTATSPSTTATFPISPTESTPPGPTPTFLEGSTSRLRCARCLSDLALSSQIISKGFTGRHGRAYLVAPPSMLTDALPSSLTSSPVPAGRKGDLPNTYTHRSVLRQLVTGQHTVGDISCAQCGCVIGWKYVAAEEEAQRYKVGKFILEGKRVVVWNGWEEEVGKEMDVLVEEGGGVVAGKGGGKAGTRFEEDEIEFDSQDEDECEDLFMGVWTPQVAARRRRMKRFGRG